MFGGDHTWKGKRNTLGRTQNRNQGCKYRNKSIGGGTMILCAGFLAKWSDGCSVQTEARS